MRTWFSTVVLAILVTGPVTSSVAICAEGSTPSFRVADDAGGSVDQTEASCAKQYDALVAQAKAALARGDRKAASDLIVAAQNQYRQCQDQDDDSDESDVALNSR